MCIRKGDPNSWGLCIAILCYIPATWSCWVILFVSHQWPLIELPAPKKTRLKLQSSKRILRPMLPPKMSGSLAHYGRIYCNPDISHRSQKKLLLSEGNIKSFWRIFSQRWAIQQVGNFQVTIFENFFSIVKVRVSHFRTERYFIIFMYVVLCYGIFTLKKNKCILKMRCFQVMVLFEGTVCFNVQSD